jgi:hypothetical protein
MLLVGITIGFAFGFLWGRQQGLCQGFTRGVAFAPLEARRVGNEKTESHY